MPAFIAKVSAVPISTIAKVSGVAKASIYYMTAIAIPAASSATLLSENFNAISEGYGVSPTGWLNNIAATIYGSTTSTRKWDIEGGTTPSSNTGPKYGMNESLTTGATTAASKYIYTETSGQYNKRFVLRTPEIDLSSAAANSTLKLEFWYHMYGANIGSLGVAITDSATSADSSVESYSGFGFTSDTGGGCDILHWTNNTGTATTTSDRITGQQQTSGHTSTSTQGYWRKAEIDLNNIAGNAAGVYVWFFAKSGTTYKGDICLDNITITGG